MIVNQTTSGVASAVSSVEDAVGISAHHWFVAIVNSRHEKKAAEQLDRLGIENYVPVQSVWRIWKNGRKAKVDHVVIPSVVFIRCTERQRRNEIVRLPFIFRFMTNRAAIRRDSTLNRPVATVSDTEINTLRFMLGQSDIPVEVTETSYKKGDLVRVTRGSLSGLEGEVIDLKNGHSQLIVRLDTLGCATLTIDTPSLTKL